MLPLLGSEKEAKEIAVSLLKEYEPVFETAFLNAYRAKLGLISKTKEDDPLIHSLLSQMHQSGVDYTNFFRRLSQFQSATDHGNVRDQFIDINAFDLWSQQYSQRIADDKADNRARQSLMRQTNPKFVLRNYLAQQAIEQAEAGDYAEIDRLLLILQSPYDEHDEFNHYTSPPPDDSKGIPLSCSS
jgi:uncharacterized protein YdiU (UPF0061 family)